MALNGEASTQRGEAYAPVLNDPELELLEVSGVRHRPRSWLVVLAAVIVFVGAPCVAVNYVSDSNQRVRGSRTTHSYTANVGDIIQEESTEARLPAKSCFESSSHWEPLNMAGQQRHVESSLEACVRRCRRTDGCAKMTYWTDGGCHLADKNAKLRSADRLAVAGTAGCYPSDQCFKNGFSFKPLEMTGRSRVARDTAVQCQEYCAGMPHCKSFTWFSDGGCHVQDQNSHEVPSGSDVITGPRQCPLVPTTTTAQSTSTTKATTSSSTKATTSTTPEPSTTPSPTTTTKATSTTEELTTTTLAATTTTKATTTTAPKTTSVAPAIAAEDQASTLTITTTHLVGCKMGVPLVISSHRQHQLTDKDGELDLHTNTSTSQQWVLSDAGHGEVYLTSDRKEQLSGKGEDVALNSSKGEAERWRITSAGLGKVFIQRQIGTFLQDFRGNVKLTDIADEWERWSIATTDDKPACQFPSLKLFCFTVIRSWGHELTLMEKQQELGAGIFGCDHFTVLSDAKKSLGGGHETTLISHKLLSSKKALHKNSDLFLTIWDRIKTEGTYNKADWTVKTDCDTVFFPDRLRARLGGPMHSRTHSTFFANCAAKDDIQSKENPRFMYGPLEVFSHKAVHTFFIGASKCKKEVGLGKSMWEERYITHCLQLLGTKINPHLSLNLLSDPHCGNTAVNCIGDAVAFHNFSSTESYTECWTTARGSEAGVANQIENKK